MRDMLRKIRLAILAPIFGLALVIGVATPAHANIVFDYDVGTLTAFYEPDTDDYRGKVQMTWIGQCTAVQRRTSATGSWSSVGINGYKICEPNTIQSWSLTDPVYVDHVYGLRIKIVSGTGSTVGDTKTICFTKSECLRMRP